MHSVATMIIIVLFSVHYLKRYQINETIVKTRNKKLSFDIELSNYEKKTYFCISLCMSQDLTLYASVE